MGFIEGLVIGIAFGCTFMAILWAVADDVRDFERRKSAKTHLEWIRENEQAN